MTSISRARLRWALTLVVIVALGLGSRLLHTGSPMTDKYLGDALYAAMVYALARTISIGPPRTLLAIFVFLIMFSIELFQLTGLPLAWSTDAHRAVRIAGKLIGTEFSFRDIAAYVAGIAGMWLVDAPPRGRYSQVRASILSERDRQ